MTARPRLGVRQQFEVVPQPDVLAMAAANLPPGRRKLCAYPFLEQMGLGAGCARGLTRQEVADSLELARTTATALEKGQRRIRPDELISLAGLNGRQVSTFVGSGPRPAEDRPAVRGPAQHRAPVRPRPDPAHQPPA